ncbi:MAG: hypothetical protein ACM3XZ_07970 [Betaproteobacteria bacterium]
MGECAPMRECRRFFDFENIGFLVFLLILALLGIAFFGRSMM